MLERIVKNRLEEHLKKNKILNEEQSGFREKHSCETTLRKTMCEWRQEMNNGNMIGIVFIDFKRAFETICRQRLIRELKMYGVRGNAIKWFQSYLEERTQQVKFGCTLSRKRNTEFGVPQGSVLGPLLFNIYLNDIVKVTDKFGCKCNLFADDTILYFSGKDKEVIENAINNTLEGLRKWLNVNSLKVNYKKQCVC